jgi:hypothetical protein
LTTSDSTLFSAGLTVLNNSAITVENCVFDNNNLINNSSASIVSGGGAAISNIGKEGDVTVKNNTFRNNSVSSAASTSGGGAEIIAGLFSDATAGLTLENNIFYNNSVNGSESDGGGAAVAVLGFKGDLRVVNNTFRNNSVIGSSGPFPELNVAVGGGLSLFSFSNDARIVSGNTFDNNYASHPDFVAGGGLWFNLNGGGGDITNNTFTNNSANSSSGTALGGGVLTGNGGFFGVGVFAFTNNVLLNNSTTSSTGDAFGGGAYIFDNLQQDITNNTFTMNTTSGKGGGLYLESNIDASIFNTQVANVYNNIVWNNTANGGGDDIFLDDDADGNNTGSNINLFNNDFTEFFSQCANTAGCTPNISQGSNINKDPLFVDAVNWDVHLMPTSPAINVGDPNAPSIPDEDFEGDPRNFGGAPDMGADETFVQKVNNLVTFVPIQSTFKTVTNTSGCPAGFTRKFSFKSRLTNISQDSDLYDLFAKVKTLTNNNLLQNADGGPGGVGSTLTVPKAGSFSDGELSPGEFVDVPFVICLKNRNKFSFFVDVLRVVGEID